MKTLNDLNGQLVALLRGRSRAAPPGRGNVKARSIGGRLRARLRSGDEGQSLLEFALVLPVLMLLMTGILSVGMAYSNQQTLTQAVASGGQALANLDQNTSNPCADTFTAITNAAPSLVAANITAKYTLNGKGYGPYTGTAANTCLGAQTSYLVSGTPVIVSATYPCNIGMYGVNFVPTCVLYAGVTENEY